MRFIAAVFLAAFAVANSSPAHARPKNEKRLRKTVTKCPKHTVPTRTVDSREPWACVLKNEKYREGIECPRGSRVITTSNTFDPFKCALKDIRLLAPRGMCKPGHRAIPTSDPEKDFDCEKLGKGFKGGPRCPRGTRPVPTPQALQPFTCIAESFKPQETEPVLAPSFEPLQKGKKKRRRKTGKKKSRPKRCPKGTRKLKTDDPFDPVRCVRSDRVRPARMRYKPYRIGGELTFKYPRDWSLNDSWRKDPPSIHIMPEEARDGRPVTLSIVHERSGHPDFVNLDARIWQEKDWQGAVEKGRSQVAGREAVHLEVPSQAGMTLVPAKDGYYVLSYSAPTELFAYYAPAYQKLLRSFKPLDFQE